MHPDIKHKHSRFRFAACLWSAGMLGVVTLSMMAIPQQLASAAVPMPVWVIITASIVQSGLLLTLAVWLGTMLAPAVGLRADGFLAAASGNSIAVALKPQLLPGLLGGLAGGIGLLLAGTLTPSALSAASQQAELPILARVLYGGITEELLLRWGVMTVFVWLAWRFLQRRHGKPRTFYVWLAIVLSAVLFGVGHLPAVVAMLGELSGEVFLYIVGANSLFGLLFGYLFWRHGLEAAIIAHGLSHIVSYLVLTAMP